jgi:hypothetical protein
MARTSRDPETLALYERLRAICYGGAESADRPASPVAAPVHSSGFAEDRPPAYRPEPRVLTEEEKAEGWRKLRALHERMKAYPPTGLVADKAFYDSLYE